ncbi:hypothetical protein MNBD_NITROSPINAE04-1693, partial [hydrothermal vent metagenome]
MSHLTFYNAYKPDRRTVMRGDDDKQDFIFSYISP